MKRIGSICLCFLLVFGCAVALIGVSNEVDGVVVIEDHLTYTSHDPIYIDGDADFTVANGVTPGGTGTSLNPYVIEGWEINTSASTGIEIVNTTSYFEIIDCRMFNEFEIFSKAVILNNITNGTIKNTEMLNNSVEIMQSDCVKMINNTIKGNNTYYTYVWIEQSDYITIKNNTMVGSGLSLSQSSGSKIIENEFSFNYSEAHFSLCDSLFLWNNTFINCGVGLTSTSLIETVEIYPNNTVNGKPIYFYKNQNNLNIDGWDVGQIILYCCSNFTLSNLLITNTSCGLHSMASIYGSIQNFTFKGGNTGIYLDGGYNITLDEVFVKDSGITIENVDESEFSNVTTQNCGFSLRNSDNNLVNNITASGMYLGGSDWNNISNVNISNSIGDGLYFVQAENNTIINASINNSGRYGIMMWLKCKYNLIKDFNIENCTDSAIYMMEHPSGSPGYNIFENGQIINNLKSGEFEESSNTQIINCTFQKNKFGLTIEDSPNFLISNSKFNQTGIITIENSNGSSIISNSIFDTGYGLVINASKNLTIRGNQIENITKFNWNYNETSYPNQGVYQNDPDWNNYSSFEEQLATGQLGAEPLYTKAVLVENATLFKVHIVGQADAPDIDLGIFLDGKDGNPIDGITQTGEFVIYDADADADEEVTLEFPEDGTYLIRVFGFTVSGNPGHFDMDVTVSAENSTAIRLENSTATIIGNIFENNTQGILIDSLSAGSKIYHNNFLNNTIHALDYGSNTWDNGFPSGGNHWDNWTAPDNDKDGFVDSPLIIGNGNQDDWPFASIWTNDTEPPVAEAGENQTIYQEEMAIFNGTGSLDNVGIVNYTWNFTYDETPYTLYKAIVNFTFNLVGNYSVNLTIQDAAGNSDVDQMWIFVKENIPPIADAGANQTVAQGETVVFNGSGSSDNYGIVNYTWSFVYNGTSYFLYGVIANFTFYSVGNYSVNLTVQDDAGNSDTDQMWINVRDSTPPVADAGPDQQVNVTAIVTFDCSDSTDNVAITNYTWTFTHNGTQITLYNVSPQFTFWAAGNYTVTLNVTDAAGNWDTDTMTVSVSLIEDEQNGGSGWWIVVLILIIVASIVVVAFIFMRKPKTPEPSAEQDSEPPG